MISLVNPRSPFLEHDAVMPPLGLFYLVAVLKKKGIDAQVIDLALNQEIPDGPVFITGTTPQYEEALKARRQYSVLGGPHASICSEEAKKNFNLVVVGEGEEVIEHVVKEMPTGIITASRIRDLDNLPFPDRTTAHQYHWTINGKKATTAITSRGCNGHCSFCCKAVMNRGIFFRSPQNVIDEMIFIKHSGFDAVMFYDDSIAMDRIRLLTICRGIKRLGMTWRCFVRSDQVDYLLLAEMAEAGCYEILLGVESGSDKILKNIRKQETVEQHREAIRLIKKCGIRVKALMITGLPGESWETVELSRQFILETQPDELDVTILSVYPGCHIHRSPEKYQLSFSAPIYYKGRAGEYQSSVSTPYMSASEIVEAQKLLYQTYLNL
jgi:anaerobic magnesium-protoporphyrin IX monomethyl ester cyclase